MVSRLFQVLAVSVVVAVPAAAQTAANRPVTFTKDIAPILQRSCQQCHRPGSIAPMSLLTYEQARPYARAMKLRTALARSQYGREAMPPWFIEKTIGIQHFKDDISLSDEEIATIAKWADSGAPEGDPRDLPPPRTFASAAEWTLGTPDLIVSSPTVLVQGIGPDWWGNPWQPQPIGITEDRYIASIEYKEVPEGDVTGKAGSTVGALYLMHHATAGISSGEQDDQQANTDADAGESGLPIHEVGRNGDAFPEDAGRLLKAGSRLVWGNVHLHSPGVLGDRKAHLEIGIRLHPKGYTPRYESRGAGFGRSELEINANEANQKVEAYWVAPQPVRLVNFEPHMHAAGIRMCLEAIYQRSIETLNCAGYDHNWVKNYVYDENAAPLLPKGTILKATAWFDTTGKNANISEPRNALGWGRRSGSNMFIAFEQMVFLTDQQYQEQLAKRREYLDRTQGWSTLVGCPGCWQRPVPAAIVAFETPAAAQHSNVGGQDPGLTYASGQSVVPIFSGWSENPDGTFDLHFSYLNRNWVEEVDIPIGSDNQIEPAPFGPDAGQPAHFLPRNNRWQFKVRVPADFGSQEVIWTLTSHGQTYRAYGMLKPAYVVDDFAIQHEFASDSTPGRHAPALQVEGGKQRTVKVGHPLPLIATAADPNPVRPRINLGPGRAEGAAGGGEVPAGGARDPGQIGPGAVGGDSIRTSPTGLRFAWYVYRSPGAAVTFDPPMPFKVWEDQRGGSPWSPGWQPPPIPPGNKWIYNVTFHEAGTYVLRALAHNGSKFTYEDVTFTATP